MKKRYWSLLILAISVGMSHGTVKASVGLQPPEPTAVLASNPRLDIELIMKVLNIDRHSNDVIGFIKQHIPMAISEMQQTGIPASITLAQLILETGYGSSELFLEANNGFGIKEKQAGNSFFYKGELYKEYKDIGSSFKDHSKHLLSKSDVKKLLSFKVRDFRLWTKMLTDIGYAEDSTYQAKIDNIIERYSFYEIDKIVWAAADDVKRTD